MSSTLTPPPAGTPDVHLFEYHWQDEADAAYLYRVLADAEPDPRKQDLYRRLADVEERHVEIWAKLMAQHGRKTSSFKPSMRARLLARLGGVFGPGFLLPMLLAEEGREVKAYMDMHRAPPPGVPARGGRLPPARESAGHARRCPPLPGATVSRGIARNQAATSVTWSTDSMMG
jgi:hypothetical protein